MSQTDTLTPSIGHNSEPAGIGHNSGFFYDLPTVEELAKETEPLLETAKEITIDCPTMYEMASEELKTIKGKAKEIDKRRKEITVPLDDEKKKVMDRFRPAVTNLETAESIIKKSMLAYDDEQRKIAAEAARKAEAEAEAERQRLRDEAAKLAEAGDHEAAMEQEAVAEMVTAVAPVVEAPKAQGVATTTRWSAEVTDKVAFLKHVLSDPSLIDMVLIDMKPLNQMATALKDKLNIPGIKAVATTGLSVRG